MKGKTHQETKEKLDKHYGDSAPSIRTVYKWFQNFRSGHMGTSDAERSGRPVEVTTPEIIDKIHAMVMDYLEMGKTIAGAYYSSLLDRLKTELQEKRPRLAHKKVLFHHDNAPSHTSAVVVAKLMEIGFQLLSHPPYSPDLAPSDYYLFPNLKKWLAEKKLYSNEEVIAETNGYFSDLDKSYYLEGINKLEQRWTKCISLKGDYVEK